MVNYISYGQLLYYSIPVFYFLRDNELHLRVHLLELLNASSFSEEPVRNYMRSVQQAEGISVVFLSVDSERKHKCVADSDTSFRGASSNIRKVNSLTARLPTFQLTSLLGSAAKRCLSSSPGRLCDYGVVSQG